MFQIACLPEPFTDVHEHCIYCSLFKSGKVLLTQCEAEGFRRITYFLDRPDVMSTYQVRLAANQAEFPALLSNGNQKSGGACDNEPAGRHFAVFEDPFPKPCYLFALVAGQLEALTEIYQHPDKPNGKKVAVNIWSNAASVSKLHWSMKSVKMAMKWDEDVFGLEYDLDVFNIVCVRDFNMGAMENKSLNVFVSSLLLASPDTATGETLFHPSVSRLTATENPRCDMLNCFISYVTQTQMCCHPYVVFVSSFSLVVVVEL